MLNLRLIYSLVLWLLLPSILFRLLWRARKQPEYLRHIGERFGFYSIRGDRPIIWLHTVSVGETRAAQALIARLRTSYPDHQILLTHTTPTGRTASTQLFGDSVLRVYLPYDYPFAVNRFLRLFRPRLGILMETEIWPNLIYACRSKGTPLLLLNARMSEKSARGYARFARLTREAFDGLAAVAAQSADDAARLTRLGAHNVSVTGNLKFDIEPPVAMLELGQRLRERLGAARKVFLAASTRDGEETLLLDALQQVQIPGLLLVVVPRHPQRFAEVATLLQRHGMKFVRRSELSEPGDRQDGTVRETIQAVLGDSMGEMFAYYSAADVAFIGGSLRPYGGQNLIEACAVGTPVIVGPHTHNFAEVTQLAVVAGAATQVQNADALVTELQRLLSGHDALHEMRKRCRTFVKSNRGATKKSLLVVAAILGRNQAENSAGQ